MRRMALTFVLLGSAFCVAQDPPVIPQVAPATVVVSPAKPVQTTAQTTAPATTPATTQSQQNPCKPKPAKTETRKKFPTGSGHEPI
jgi:hypothetical protein